MAKASFKFAVASIAALTVLASGASAQTVNFYFSPTSDSTGSIQASSMTIGATQGSTATLSVWVKSSSALTVNQGQAYIEFDRTNGTDPNSATLLDNKIGLSGGKSALVPTTTSFSAFGSTPNYSIRTTNNLNQNISAPYGYGIEYDFAPTTGAGTSVDISTPRKLFDITFTNLGLSSGQQYTVSMPNVGDDEFNNNFVNRSSDAQKFVNPGTQLTFTAVPEPASMLVLGLGLLPVLRRRRAGK